MFKNLKRISRGKRTEETNIPTIHDLLGGDNYRGATERARVCDDRQIELTYATEKETTIQVFFFK